MALAVVELGDPRWEETLRAAAPDVFHRPEFGRFRQEATGDRAVLLRFDSDRGLVFDVTLVREVSRLPFYARRAPGLAPPPIDLASPEYTGPIVVAAAEDRAALVAEYRRALSGLCREWGVVTEFVRFHPFAAAAGAMPAVETLVSAGELVYVDVGEGYDKARAGYRAEHRSALRRAERAGVEAGFAAPEAARVARFAELYAAGLAGKDVKSYLRLDRPYFEALFRHLGDRARLVESRVGGAVASAAIFLVEKPHVWYMYGASTPEGLAAQASKPVFDRVIAWAAAEGHQRVCLGGGFAPGDGLFQFKRGYSRATARVTHLRKVHAPDVLRRLLEAKAADDAERGRPTRLDYFPSYWLD